MTLFLVFRGDILPVTAYDSFVTSQDPQNTIVDFTTRLDGSKLPSQNFPG